MRVHHLNCTSMCPPGGRFFDGRSPLYRSATLVCHCLLVETRNGLVLVDTGFGLGDDRRPRPRLSPVFLAVNRPWLREAQTAVRQIEALGYSARDVRHIVLTHLDFDHAGGLDDFPAASVHLLDVEEKAAARQRTPLDRMRYRPQQWASRPRWVTYHRSEGEPWFGFECVRQLAGVPPGILLVPLAGHTLGHAGVAIESDGGWLLHAGDAYFYRAGDAAAKSQLHAGPARVPAADGEGPRAEAEQPGAAARPRARPRRRGHHLLRARRRGVRDAVGASPRTCRRARARGEPGVLSPLPPSPRPSPPAHAWGEGVRGSLRLPQAPGRWKELATSAGWRASSRRRRGASAARRRRRRRSCPSRRTGRASAPRRCRRTSGRAPAFPSPSGTAA